jgi:RHS repeat-associated protein
VLATVSDRKIAHSSNSSTIDYYTADVISAQDYYPFGMIMPGRTAVNGNGNRYGYNTQEEVDEISGAGNHTTAKYWEYDTRLGRRWNLDPIYNTDISRYAVNGNNPIYYLDPNGDFKTKFGAKVYNFLHGGKGEIRKATGGENKGEWFVGKQVEYKGEGAGVAYERKFGWDKGNPANAIDAAADGVNKGIDFAKRNASNAWNSRLARYYIPDYYTFSGSFQTSSGIYMNEELTFTLLLRGMDPGLYFNTTTGFGGVTSVGVDVGCSVGKGYYIGDARKLSSSMLGGWQGSGSVGVGLKAIVGGSINGGVDVGFDDNGKPTTITGKVGISVGVGVSTPVLQGGIGTGKATNAVPVLKF